ncbi:nSTAND1 domain-containing NTPase [Saccharothrix coeruleofusca]|uniref:nSTAND1 domain-containing NTPase n=1 Tax=Saccharothrix coeruleofusca TaxID=33919 RepID=UPI003557A459
MRSGGLVAVTGASGVGKSSLLRAGLATALTDRPPGWSGTVDRLVKTMTPGSSPPAQLNRNVPELAEVLPVGKSAEQFDDAVRRAVTTHAEGAVVTPLDWLWLWTSSCSIQGGTGSRPVPVTASPGCGTSTTSSRQPDLRHQSRSSH